MTDKPKNSSSASTEEHRAQAPQCVCCFVLTVSDTRTVETDSGGKLIADLLESAGHRVIERQIVTDTVASIESSTRHALDSYNELEAIIVTGGSGIGISDVTPEALHPMLTKEMPGFGEVFRLLSYQEVGAATMLSRAFAGTIEATLLFVLPGSTNAVRLAMEKLILPELGHLVRELRPDRRQLKTQDND